jgi:hypothetical protein
MERRKKVIKKQRRGKRKGEEEKVALLPPPEFEKPTGATNHARCGTSKIKAKEQP